MFRPNLLQFNLRNTLLAIAIILFLGLLSSCSKKGYDWWIGSCRSKIHFGSKHYERDYNRFNDRDSDFSQVIGPQKEIAIEVGIALDDHEDNQYEPNEFDINYTCAEK